MPLERIILYIKIKLLFYKLYIVDKVRPNIESAIKIALFVPGDHIHLSPGKLSTRNISDPYQIWQEKSISQAGHGIDLFINCRIYIIRHWYTAIGYFLIHCN